jgi:hypothetical protein
MQSRRSLLERWGKILLFRHLVSVSDSTHHALLASCRCLDCFAASTFNSTGMSLHRV